MLDPSLAEAIRYPLIALAILANLFTALLLATSWQSIPASVPAHYNLAGYPDRWGGRWNLLLLAAVQTGLNGMFFFVDPGDLFFAYLRAVVGVMMAYVVWISIRIARAEASRLHPLLLYTLLAILVVPAILKSVVK